MSKTLKTIFTLSVVLNVLLLGAGAGFAYKEWGEDAHWRMAKSNMSPQSREMLTQGYKKMHNDVTPLLSEMRKSREQLRVAMTQDNFDTAQYDAAIQRMRTLRQQMGDRMSAATKAMVAELPPEERKKMANHIAGGFGWKSGKSGHWRCTLESYGPGKDKTGEGDSADQSD